MRIEEQKTPRLLILILVESAISLLTMIAALERALSVRYQESVFLFGIALIVLAFSIFTYRVYRYPDQRAGSTESE